jgi:hypothetical protein
MQNQGYFERWVQAAAFVTTGLSVVLLLMACSHPTPAPDPLVHQDPPQPQIEPQKTEQPPKTQAAEPAASITSPFAAGVCPKPDRAGAQEVGNAKDQSRAVPPGQARPGGSFKFSDWPDPGRDRYDPQRVRFCGRVSEVKDGKVSLVVTGQTQPTRFDFRVAHAPMPFGVGDAISVTASRRIIQIHDVRGVFITDEAGKLLFASSGSGSARYAPGWGVSPMPAPTPRKTRRKRRSTPPGFPQIATELTLGMVFTHAGKRGQVPPHHVRLLDTPDGTYALTGFSKRWTKGKRPPDTSNYSFFQILRIAGPPDR